MSVTVLAPEPVLLGREEPRLWTRPLRPLTERTSLGFEAVRFATDVLGIKLLPWQRWWLVHALEIRAGGGFRFRTVVTLVGRQAGKALDVDTPMLTTAGWSTMGALREGDELFHPDGHPTRVVGAFGVMHGRPCYRVTTTDGRSIVADADHLWTVQDVRRGWTAESWTAGRCVVGPDGAHRPRVRAWETLTTEQLLSRGVMRFSRPRKGGGVQREFAYRLPVQRAITSKPVDLPIDPYLLGVWLGDGTSVSALLTVGDRDLGETCMLIEAAGARIVSKRRDRTAWTVRISLDERRRDVCTLRAALAKLGVLGDKHVPDGYLTAGTEQRLALLQGLMDTDGSIFVTGSGTARAEFSACNQRLADAVLYLARSLGWRATIRENAATLNGRRWRVCFTPERGDPVPFRLRRKAERVQAPNARGGELHAVSIASIEPVESRPVRCIKVERGDGLFLAGRDLVATHNTTLCKILALWALYLGRAHLVLGVAQALDIADESWNGAVELAENTPELAAEVGRVLRGNGKNCLTLSNGARYRTAAANGAAGRGLSVDLLLLDELRMQRDWEAWSALSKTTLARPDSLTVCTSNAGDVRSVVLNALRSAALAGTDDTLGILEWSAPDGCGLEDEQAVAQACPGVGYGTVTWSAIRSARTTDPPSVFRAEVLCQHVDVLDAAMDPAGWAACADRQGTLAAVRDRVAAVVDVAPDGGHVTLCGAAVLDDGTVRGEVLGAWGSTDAARAALGELLAAVRPGAVGWFPTGPGAVLGPDLPEDAVKITGGAVPAACQGLADLVRARRVRHPDDPLLNAHVAGSQRLESGDGWRFARRGAGHVDAVYAFAGAVHLARTLPAPAPMPQPMVV